MIRRVHDGVWAEPKEKGRRGIDSVTIKPEDKDRLSGVLNYISRKAEMLGVLLMVCHTAPATCSTDLLEQGKHLVLLLLLATHNEIYT